MDLEFREVRSTDFKSLSGEAAALLSSGRIRIWISVHESREVGHCEGDSTTGEIVGLAILPSYQRRGIGTRLLQLVVDSLRAAGAKRIWLDAPRDPTQRPHSVSNASTDLDTSFER